MAVSENPTCHIFYKFVLFVHVKNLVSKNEKQDMSGGCAASVHQSGRLFHGELEGEIHANPNAMRGIFALLHLLLRPSGSCRPASEARPFFCQPLEKVRVPEFYFVPHQILVYHSCNRVELVVVLLFGAVVRVSQPLVLLQVLPMTCSMATRELFTLLL